MKRILALIVLLVSGFALSAAAQTTPANAAPAGPGKIAVCSFQAAVGQTNEFQRDLADMQKKPVTAQELHQAKLMLLRDIPLAESSVDQIANGWLARSELGLPLDEPVRAGEIYTGLGAKDVQQAFAKWLRVDGLVQVTQGPAPK